MLTPLTTRTIDAAKPDPNGKDRYLRDGGGLELRIRPSGKKTWQYRYSFGGKRKVLPIGDYQTYSLKEARLRAQEARKCLAEAKDPAIYLHSKRAVSGKADAGTQDAEGMSHYRLTDLMQAYAQWKQDSGKLSYAQDVRQCTQRYLESVSPGIAHKLAAACTPMDMAELIRPIHERGAQRSAGKFRSMLAAAFQAAMQAPFHPGLPKSLLGFEVSGNPVAALPAIHTEPRDRVLTQDELGRYAAFVLSQKGILYHCLALSLLAGGQRPLQVARVTDADYDPEQGLLTLRDPKGKRRNPRVHLVPLGSQARAHITQWKQRDHGLNHPIWFSVDGEKVMDATSLSHQCRRIQNAVGMAHFQLRDIRRTVETEMARIGLSKDIRAHLLSHGLSGIQERHYDRYDRIQEKREALKKWETHLLTLSVPFRNPSLQNNGQQGPDKPIRV